MDLAPYSKYDENKPKLSTVPTDVLNDVAKAFTYGANKYGKYNYSSGMDYSRLYDAAQRHLNAYWSGEDIDESTNHHLDHAIASLFMLKHMINQKVGTDDRNKIYNNLKEQ